MAREYFLHVPVSYDSDIPTPLIINFHGFGGTAAEYSKVIGDFYKFDSLADISNFLVAADGRLLGRNNKQTLMGGESIHLTAATVAGQVFDTEIGRIGMMSCLEGVPPESARNLALRGAQLLGVGDQEAGQVRVGVPKRADPTGASRDVRLT